MDNNWIHCNICFVIPSQSKPYTLFITSCGHLICSGCSNGAESLTLSRPGLCKVCNKQSSYLEINRNLKPEVRCYFRSIKDLAIECVNNIKTVVDFQSFHRSRLQKYQKEKCRKAVKFARNAQTEIQKRTEIEHSLLVEQSNLKHELEKYKRNSSYLEKLVTEKEKEISKLRSRSHSPFTNRMPTPNRVFASLNGPTPLHTLSFRGCTTSTPLNTDIFGAYLANSSSSGYGSDAPLKNPFDTPTAYEQPVISGNTFLNTPALLGISCRSSEKRRSSSTPREIFLD